MGATLGEFAMFDKRVSLKYRRDYTLEVLVLCKFQRRDADRHCLGLEEISVNRARIIRMLCYGVQAD